MEFERVIGTIQVNGYMDLLDQNSHKAKNQRKTGYSFAKL